MHIALFGGSFNPPHIAHQLVCTYALSCGGFDQLWMVPTFKHAFEKPLAPYADRVAMCERAVEMFGGRVLVSRIEEELGGESYTLNTVEAIEKKVPRARLSLVVGADLLHELPSWHRYDELQKLVSMFVIGRAGFEASPGAVPGAVQGIELARVSSTEIRAAIAAHKSSSLTAVVPKLVLEYIDQKGLYR